jgi:hypothetical protein
VTFAVEIVDALTGLKKNDGTSVKLYPNPTETGQLILETQDLISWPIDITDSKGQHLNFQMTRISENQMIINTSGWSPGLYFVTVNTGKKIEVQKMVIH